MNNILLIKCLSYEILLPGDDLAPNRPFLGLELLYNGIFIITLQVLLVNSIIDIIQIIIVNNMKTIYSSKNKHIHMDRPLHKHTIIEFNILL